MVFLNFMRMRKRNRGTDMGMNNIKKKKENLLGEVKGLYSAFACVQFLSQFRIFVTPWTVARQAPLSMGFSRQKHWSGLPFPSPKGT